MTDHNFTTITIPAPGYAKRLADLAAEVDELAEAEVASTGRFGTKSKAMEKAREYDALVEEAAAQSSEVKVWQVSYLEWGQLADRHPPRDNDMIDRRRGINGKTFPRALLKIALVEPGTAENFEDWLAKGEAALGALGAISQPKYVELETTAWNLSAGDESLPKESAVSLLKRLKDQDSAQQPDSE